MMKHVNGQVVTTLDIVELAHSDLAEQIAMSSWENIFQQEMNKPIMKRNVKPINTLKIYSNPKSAGLGHPSNVLW